MLAAGGYRGFLQVFPNAEYRVVVDMTTELSALMFGRGASPGQG